MNSISEFRNKCDISQAVLANHLNKMNYPANPRGWTGGLISHYETGKRTPSLTKSRMIVKALNELGRKCSLDDVFPPKESEAA